MIMERYGKVNTKMVNGMDKVHTLILIKRNILDNILMMNVMVKELYPTRMEKNIQVNGKMVLITEMEHIHMLMVVSR